jgi:hypothetical protein
MSDEMDTAFEEFWNRHGERMLPFVVTMKEFARNCYQHGRNDARLDVFIDGAKAGIRSIPRMFPAEHERTTDI